MNDEPDLSEKLEQVGSKSLKLIEKKYQNIEPKALKLIEAFSNWLDKKLSQ